MRKGPEVLPKKEIEQRIKDFLYEQLNDEEAGLTACLVIHTVNKNPEKVELSEKSLFFDTNIFVPFRFNSVSRLYSVTWIISSNIHRRRNIKRFASPIKSIRKEWHP
jgi:hypothetical protein